MGQHHCLRCRHRLSEARGEDRRFIQASQRRNRILDRLATVGVTVRNISKDEERGQMSYEAHTIRNAKDKVLKRDLLKLL